MASSPTSRYTRKKCVVVVVTLLVVQATVLVYIRPPISLHSRTSKYRTRTQTHTISPFSPYTTTADDADTHADGRFQSIAQKDTQTHEDSRTKISGRSSDIDSHTKSEGNAGFNNTASISTPLTQAPTTEASSLTYTLRPPGIDSLPTWKKGSFCENYIGHTLAKPFPVCVKQEVDSPISCLGSPISKNMAVCTARFVAVDTKKLQSSVRDCDTCRIDGSGSFKLIETENVQCNTPNLSSLQSHVEKNDPMYRSMVDITSYPAVSTNTCKTWVNKTAYFFHSQRYHIYFRMYSYYNLYKTMLDTGGTPGEYVVVRMAESNGYKFEEFERSLFPELQTLGEFEAGTTCFREIVFSPWCYAAVMFRCKMERHTKMKCLECNGQGLFGTSLMTFRTRALQACSLGAKHQRRDGLEQGRVLCSLRENLTRDGREIHHITSRGF